MSAISFRLPPDSISAAASSGSPLSSTFVSDFSGPSIPRLAPLPFRFLTPAVSALFRMLQFWVLTTQPLFFLSFSTRFRLTVAFPVPASALASTVSPFSPAWFPMPSFQVPVLGFAVRFLSLFPASLPQLFHRCLPSAFASGIFHFRLAFFRPLVFRFQLLSLCSSFPSLPGSASQLLSRRPPPLSLPRFSLSLRPGFPCLPSRFLYSASLMVSFRPSLIRSRSCSSGAYLMLSPSVCPLPIRFLSSASLPVRATQPLFLPFLFLPVSASQWHLRCSLSAFASLVFPVLSDLVSRVFFPSSSYSASCMFPFALP